MRETRRWPVLHPGTFGILLTAGLFGVGAVWADDLVTLSGTVYHDVHAVRVEPDGVTWQYADGVCKVDFTDCAESVRRTYHYDTVKAAAYHTEQTQIRQQAEAQTRQVLQENEARKLARAQATLSRPAERPTLGADLIFQRAASPAASAATRALGAQMEAKAAKLAIEPTGVYGILAHSQVGKVLSGLGLVNFGPAGPPPNSAEVKLGMHHVAGTAFPVDAAHDAFYTPEYQTRSYYEDVDRAAAFARGVPLKP